MSQTQEAVCRRDAEQRRADVLDRPDLNGISNVEVDPADHRILSVFFIRPIPPASADSADPADALLITANLPWITVRGGTRIVGVQVTGAARKLAADGTAYLEIVVDRPGDYSVYTLDIAAPALDSYFRRIHFSFMAACPVDVDCRHEVPCLPPVPAEPMLDYLAKDYASFRRLLLDLLPQLNPDWVERNPSDLGIALVELLAYEGDRLSYFQDAVANEAYLETVRHRISARRHTRLVDYRMHDGRNAWTYVHVAVSQGCTLDQGTKLATRIVAPLRGDPAPPGPVLDDDDLSADALDGDPALATVEVFETTHGASLDPGNNEIFIHAWGNEECCLAPGTTEAFLYSAPGGTNVVRPVLRKGDLLLLEEVRDPLQGVAAQADRARRQVVLIDEEPEPTEDPLYRDALVNGELDRAAPGDPPLPLLRVRWRREDALTFPLCLSARRPDVGLIWAVSVARGNIVLADHGITTTETIALPATNGDRPFRLPLSAGPLTMHCEPGSMTYDPSTGRPRTERRDLSCEPREARPAVSVLATFPTGPELWTPVPDLLDSTPFDLAFTAEVDDGRAILRFGDGEYGRRVDGATAFTAVYRVGNGRAGNVGAEALAHIALAPGASGIGRIESVRNPLTARGGADPETIEEVRRLAPDAFRAEQFRAVTEADYAAAARNLRGVQGAVASFRWTGSWHTVFVGVDPVDPNDLLLAPTGLVALRPEFERRVRAFLTRYRLAGYDLELRPPRFVPLELDLDVCALPGHFRGDVKRAVADALSSRDLPGGDGGYFHASNFTFGQPVYLSSIYAAVDRVEGVDSVVVTRFRRFGQADAGELAAGVLRTGPWEVAQLENDPSFVERGVLRIAVRGGKG